MDRLGTHSGSSDTLARGLELADQPFACLLNLIKEEPDDEEKEMLQEIQAPYSHADTRIL